MIEITPDIVAAVKADQCEGCGRQSYEDCPRPTDKACFREFFGGQRARTGNVTVLPVIRVERY